MKAQVDAAGPAVLGIDELPADQPRDVTGAAMRAVRGPVAGSGLQGWRRHDGAGFGTMCA
jgi:hypothetical protein